MNKSDFYDQVHAHDDELRNRKIEPAPVPKKEIGVDLENSVLQNIVDTMTTSHIDINALSSFTHVSRSRNELYDIIDSMADDATLSAVLETYAEDATEMNDQGDIMWCESADAEIAAFITYLLNSLNVNKNLYKWTHSLCKYGDVYLRLYRESEYDDLLFKNKNDPRKNDRSTLNEDIKIKYYGPEDNYVHYLEMAPNPAQIFELTRFGKTAAYIKTNIKAQPKQEDIAFSQYSFTQLYRFDTQDVELFSPTEFVHACLEDNSSRTPEEVELFSTDTHGVTYSVKRGESLLQSVYKIWRQLMLLENSVLLNRVTQSSIVRVIGVEVGDMPKESIPTHLMNIKQLIEQKAAIDSGNSMSEYTNPGPIVNNIYIPTRNGQGSLTTSQIGGDVNVGELTDLDYYQNKLFGGLRVPKQYFNLVDDGAGFSGGQSLSIISSRYAKMIKRIQNAMIQLITDAINLILIATNNEAYINKFTLRMQSPTTQEEVDRRENITSKIGLVSDVMNTLSEVENPLTKLKILKSLLSSTITNNEVIDLLQQEVADIEKRIAEEAESDNPVEEDSAEDLFGEEELMDFGSDTFESNDMTATSDETTDEDDFLPAPEELNIGDVSDSTNTNLEN